MSGWHWERKPKAKKTSFSHYLLSECCVAIQFEMLTYFRVRSASELNRRLALE